MKRSAASVASCARSISASGIDWPKEIVAVLIMPPQPVQSGSRSSTAKISRTQSSS